jgi:phosphoribosyl-AMP cyclohydrolase
MRADDQRQHQPAEQARPGLLEAEQQELVRPAVQTPALGPRPGPGVERRDPALDPRFDARRRGAICAVMTSQIFPPAADKTALERGAVIAPRFDANGLVAAIAQHADTGEILMFAWMNDEALKLTLDTGIAHYFSRSRNSLWKKGETSGQLQVVTELRIDCDQDAVLIKVRPQGDGGACHVGFRSCFYRVWENDRLVEREA